MRSAVCDRQKWRLTSKMTKIRKRTWEGRSTIYLSSENLKKRHQLSNLSVVALYTCLKGCRNSEINVPLIHVRLLCGDMETEIRIVKGCVSPNINIPLQRKIKKNWNPARLLKSKNASEKRKWQMSEFTEINVITSKQTHIKREPNNIFLVLSESDQMRD